MLTNAKITIFNQWPDRERRKMVFIPRVIHKAWFHTNQKSTVCLLYTSRLYSAMGPNVMSRDGNPFFNAYSPEIRDESFFNGYNRIIQKVEFNCGLAYGTLSDPQVVDKTAEEIKASKQRSYATVKSIQNSLGNALENLVAAVEVWMSLGGIAAEGKVEDVYKRQTLQSLHSSY